LGLAFTLLWLSLINVFALSSNAFCFGIVFCCSCFLFKKLLSF
jgi:hypothetical protein